MVVCLDRHLQRLLGHDDEYWCRVIALLVVVIAINY